MIVNSKGTTHIGERAIDGRRKIKISLTELREDAVAQLAEALRYTPEGWGFDSQCCHWNFSLT
jgi:hypothetical protein